MSSPENGISADPSQWSVRQLKDELRRLAIDFRGCVEKQDLLVALQNAPAIAASAARPALPRRDLRNLVLTLGADSRPEEQFEALRTLTQLCYDPENWAAIVAAGAIPMLVQLLRPGASHGDDLQMNAIAALSQLAQSAELAAPIAAAGAIPLLVQLMRPGSAVGSQHNAAAALIPLSITPANKVAIAAAGAIPLLVRLLRPGAPPNVQLNAMSTLTNLAANSANVLAIVDAGAIPAIVQLMGPDSDDIAHLFLSADGSVVAMPEPVLPLSAPIQW
ncbi:hypothetical protein FOA52_002980 [Chlamydomonas sp. UWO 241]|nr:hypothetical protein FOA52_002980 [Chlamydomonas sp. UWO 241]